MAPPDPANIGATPDELASQPALLLDLATSLYARRTCLTTGLLGLLGGQSGEKVKSLSDAIREQLYTIRTADPGRSLADQFRQYRELGRRIGCLEDAVFALVTARVRVGTRVVPDATPGIDGGMGL